MDLATNATWSAAALPVLLATILLLCPGWIVAWLLGFDKLDSAGLAGPLSVCLLLVAGLVTAAVGLPWTVAVGVTVIAAMSALIVISMRFVRRQRLSAVDDGDRGTVVGFAVGAGLAAVGTAWKFISGTTSPDALSQEADVQFHLQAVQHLVELTSANPLISGDVVFYAPSFYPGGLHSIAATVAGWSGANVVVSTHATLLVCAALVWPLGVVALVRRVVSPSGWVLASAGVLALSAFFAPLVMLSLGGAWANLVAGALIPGALVPVAVATMRKTNPGWRTVLKAGLALGASTAGATLVQPNAAYAIALLSIGLGAPTIVRWGRPWVLALSTVIALVVAAWIVPLPPAMLEIPIVPDVSIRRAVLLLLKGGDLPLWAGGVAAALTLLGVAVALFDHTARGVALAWTLTFALALSLQFGDLLPIARLTWPWWSGYARITNVLSVAVILAGCVGVRAVVGRLACLRKRTRVACNVAVLAILAVAAGPAMRLGEELVRSSYSPESERFYYANSEEIAALAEIESDLDHSSIVALDPLRGGTILNLLGSRTVPVGPFFANTEDTVVIAANLDAAASDVAVCDAVRSLGITHALVGGDAVLSFSPLVGGYPGIKAVPSALGFSLVATAGNFQLYSVPTQCQVGG